ncbi:MULTISPECIES: DUF1353 domain-containing protein [unclassified Pseudomonas]|uniref:DUF1353 domain-containing protein n=1 Tax=unclassified Pseudomonas TaxID=196821 RepID=UPI001CBC23AE|nr:MULTISPECIES: DUF1353 domain-containing protein [unclassified Pseudomonas]
MFAIVNGKFFVFQGGLDMRVLILLFLVLTLQACAPISYRETDEGRFEGALDVRWIKNDYFLFVPSKDDPFRFTRSNGEVIRPGPMYTDGGSIPRFLWGVNGYSPWGYAPAYIIHDWLFVAHECGYPGYKDYSFKNTHIVLAEGLKAVMEVSPEIRNYFVFESVVAAVSSPIAKRLWEKGICNDPVAFNLLGIPEQTPPGELLMTIKFK